MIFKKMEMHGFKSFFDRTEVHFRGKINAVVGPNGCGKSNIADAIRWVLGEQSPKQLRGERMEDIIFSGSESRHPLGMAEVCLTVETNGTEVPSPYNKFSEISVTRRLYRSGESEFLINNTPCRLRDIRELFLDTGMNPKAYAVIDQGNVGTIISSRPEDRRILIEEAAGIAKYKERKVAALRKLDSTQQNLLRLGDIVKEVKRQISSLNRQARKAERYKKFRAEIEEVELQTLFQQYCLRGEEQASQASQNAALQELRETVRTEILSADTSLEAGKLSLVDLEKRVQTAREEFYSHRARLESVEHQLENNRVRLEQIRGNRTRGEAELGRLSGLLDELAGERAHLEEELEKVQSLVEERDHQCRHQSADLARITAAARQIKTQLDEGKGRFLEEVRSEGELRNRITQAETRSESLQREQARLESEVRHLTEQESVLGGRQESERTRLDGKKRELEAARQALTICSAALTKVAAELEQVERELHQAHEQYSHSSSRVSSLTELEKNLSGWPERFEEELNRILAHHTLSGGVKGRVAGLIRVPPEHETALEAVLGEKLKSLLVNSVDTAVDAAQLLRDERFGRGTFLPLQPRRRSDNGTPQGPEVLGRVRDLVSVGTEYQEVIEHLLHNVFLVKDLAAALPLWSTSDSGWTFVTPTGEVLWPDGSITAGLPDPSREILPLVRKIREARQTAGAAEENMRQISNQREEIRKHRADLESEAEKIGDTVYRLGIEASSLEKDLSLTRQKLQAHLDQRIRLEKASAEAATEKDDLDVLLADQRERQSEMATGRKMQEEHIANLDAELTALLVQEEQLEGNLNGWQIELAAGRERAAHLRSRLERSGAEEAQSEQRRKELADDLVRIGEEQQQEEARLTQLQQDRDGLAGSREVRERLLGEAQDEQRAAAGRVHETEETLRQLRLQADKIQQEATDLQIQQAEGQVRLEHFKEQVAEKKHCLPEDLWDEETRKAVRHLPATQLEEQHRALTTRIQALGPVNLAAIGDHEELQARLQFLQNQHQDLEQAAQDLYQAIQKINSTSRRRFLETFEKINERFQGVFPILFEKGQATLRLTDTDDPLDAGIEVLAQPAGKKLQRLSLLSGGEKALSALALLLAIFMVKPTPFCLMDEVDAPLDESNTDRFLTLLDKSINGSQLVIITHNKKTMENADHMVGVTMADPGISTLLSVHLSDRTTGPQDSPARDQ